jgi:hypothetical protein
VNSRFETGGKKNVTATLVQRQLMLNWTWATTWSQGVCTVQKYEWVTLALVGLPDAPKRSAAAECESDDDEVSNT